MLVPWPDCRTELHLNLKNVCNDKCDYIKSTKPVQRCGGGTRVCPLGSILSAMRTQPRFGPGDESSLESSFGTENAVLSLAAGGEGLIRMGVGMGKDGGRGGGAQTQRKGWDSVLGLGSSAMTSRTPMPGSSTMCSCGRTVGGMGTMEVCAASAGQCHRGHGTIFRRRILTKYAKTVRTCSM